MGEGGFFRRRRRTGAEGDGAPSPSPPPPNASPPTSPPPTDADRALAAAAIAGMVSQVQHEQSMEDQRGREPMVVRLVAQLPIRDVVSPRSWLGGGAALPDGTAWPELDGQRAMALAQICCADLPAGLWEGAGPRHGWLVVFMHGGTYEVEVLHVPELGRYGPGPDVDEGIFAAAHGLRLDDAAHLPRRALPRWPVDVIAVGPDDPDPRVDDGNGRANLHAEHRAGYDVASPGYRPFDWASTTMMLDLLEEGVEKKRKVAHGGASAAEQQMASFRDALTEAERNGAPDAELTRLRNRLDDLPVLIDAYTRAAAVWDVALPQIADVVAELRAAAASDVFSDDRIAPLLERLHGITWTEVRRQVDRERGSGAERIDVLQLRITEHHPEAALWVHRYEALRFDWAKHAYASDPSSLPPAVREHYEVLWRDIARSEMAGMGHVPWGYVHEFDLADDITLLELPTSALMSWMFGDVDHLVLTMTRADLAAGAYDRIKVQWSN